MLVVTTDVPEPPGQPVTTMRVACTGCPATTRAIYVTSPRDDFMAGVVRARARTAGWTEVRDKGALVRWFCPECSS